MRKDTIPTKDPGRSPRTSILSQRGFTFLEALLVVAVIAILVAIIVIALNPGKQLGDSRNSQRQADVNTILHAIYQYAGDNNGKIPSIPLTATEICATGSSSCNNLVDLSVLTTNEKYLTVIPKDPQCSTTCATSGTGYKIVKTTNNQVTVSAPAAEQDKTIHAIH